MGIHPVGVDSQEFTGPDPNEQDRDTDTDEAPETPLDEPRPPRVQDPPPQPDQKGPYVVQIARDDAHRKTEAQ